MNDQELSVNAHSLIHSLRLINGYKASEAEKKLSRWVIERYKGQCAECRQVDEQLKKQPEKKEGVLSRIKDAIGGVE